MAQYFKQWQKESVTSELSPNIGRKALQNKQKVTKQANKQAKKPPKKLIGIVPTICKEDLILN